MESLDGWTLERVFDTGSIFQLASASSGKSVLQGFAAKRQNQEAAAKLLSTLHHLSKVGVASGFKTGIVKRLEGDIVEVKVSGSVTRAVSYQHAGEEAIVVVSIERGHQGSGNMHRAISHAQSRAPIIKALLDGRSDRSDGTTI